MANVVITFSIITLSEHAKFQSTTVGANKYNNPSNLNHFTVLAVHHNNFKSVFIYLSLHNVFDFNFLFKQFCKEIIMFNNKTIFYISIFKQLLCIKLCFVCLSVYNYF